MHLIFSCCLLLSSLFFFSASSFSDEGNTRVGNGGGGVFCLTTGGIVSYTADLLNSPFWRNWDSVDTDWDLKEKYFTLMEKYSHKSGYMDIALHAQKYMSMVEFIPFFDEDLRLVNDYYDFGFLEERARELSRINDERGISPINRCGRVPLAYFDDEFYLINTLTFDTLPKIHQLALLIHETLYTYHVGSKHTLANEGRANYIQILVFRFLAEEFLK